MERPRSRAGRGRSVLAAVLAVGAATVGVAASTRGSPRDRDRDASSPAAARVVAANAPTGGEPPSHEADEGFSLRAARTETVSSGPRCRGHAPVQHYDVVAIAVDITLNRYLDHDPNGRMFVLKSELAHVRDEQARNRDARSGQGDGAVSTGLQGDAIQPLTLRVRQGECLRIVLRNALSGSERASIHVHGTSLRVVGPGRGPAVAANPDASVPPGKRVTYEWMVGRDEPEGTHYLHSHGDERKQTYHGLFGAVIVEPAGSQWLDARTGRPQRSGWDSIVRTADGSAFREFALYYHELGDETYQLLDRHDRLVPQVDPITHIYRPDGRAINYRSEPFMNRLALQHDRTRIDESLEYSSYSYGDPATPIMRSYLGEPVKQRVIHAGGEVFHVHHVHGGGIRWRRQPRTEPSGMALGLDKHPPLVPRASAVTDAQALGPSETYDVENECGSGGCQQSAGDFMYHCHVTQHYFAGMWGIWRVYNSLQDGAVSTDTMPVLAPLPDRAGAVAAAVASDHLAGTTVDWSGQQLRIDDVESWVRMMLPPAGRPRAGDASVWDWRFDGGRAVGEPESSAVFPGYRARAPGTRPLILFDPHTGKPAFPMLRPHLNARPPFAPGHGPAPFLDPMSGRDAAPGASGAASTCPAGTRTRDLKIDVVPTSITQNAKNETVDPEGEIYVLHDQLATVERDPSRRGPLVVRANATQDCLDVLLRSRLTDNADDPFTKVGAHIHFMQFDVQASDGVDTGFNYEQTIRPFAADGTTVTRSVTGGALLPVADPARFTIGSEIGIGMDDGDTFETRAVVARDATSVTLDAPLQHPHSAGAWVSAEFVRYRWYPDMEFGTAFFHDHVNVVHSGRHGLYGAVVVEPPGSTYTDPHTGAPVESGVVADVHTDGRVSPDVRGSFREIVLGIQDDNPLSHVGRSTGSAIDERVEPLDDRLQEDPDTALAFSSKVHGDPATPVVEANLGDPLAFRTLVGASNDMHSWHLDGHWFRVEPYSRTSPPANTVNIGISERYDLFVPSAGGVQRRPGDYLYYSGRSFKLREGSWGILRVYSADDAARHASDGLRVLPGHSSIPAAAASVCPHDAPRRRFDVAAVDVALPMLQGATGKVYVLERDRADVSSGRRRAEPLVLHVGVGDCIDVRLTNRTASGRVSFHADMLGVDPARSAGVAAGREPDQSVAPGAARTYEMYASPVIGPTTAMVRDWGNVLVNPGKGLYGAIVVGPPGTRWTDPHTGADVGDRSSWSADAHPVAGAPWRDITLFFQDEDPAIGSHKMPYSATVSGVVGVNYRSSPVNGSSPSAQGAPSTPTIEAIAGDAVHLHVLAPWSEQAQVFSVEGHTWPVEPGERGTTHVSSTALVGLDALDLELDGGAGGPPHAAGTYTYGDHREPYREAGMWGRFVVEVCGDHETIRRLGPAQCGEDRSPADAIAVTVVVVLGAFVMWMLRRRRRLTT